MISKRQVKRKLGYVLQFDVNPACVANVSVWFRSKEWETRFKDRPKKWRKYKSGEKNRESREAKTENPLPRSFFAMKPKGNACYAG